MLIMPINESILTIPALKFSEKLSCITFPIISAILAGPETVFDKSIPLKSVEKPFNL